MILSRIRLGDSAGVLCTPSVAADRLEQAHKEGYREGLDEGLRRFAWWKDGVQYVGTSGTTLKEALAEAAKEVK